MESSCGLAKTEQIGKVKTVTTRADEILEIDFIEYYLTEVEGLSKLAKAVFWLSLVLLKMCRGQAKALKLEVFHYNVDHFGVLQILRFWP